MFFSIDILVNFSNFKRFKGVSLFILFASRIESSHLAKSIIDKLYQFTKEPFKVLNSFKLFVT